VWPFYVDIRITENIGINPQRIVLILILLAEIFTFVKPRIKKYKHLNLTWVLILSFYIFFRFFVGVWYSDSYSIILSAYEIISIFLLAIICAKYLTFHDLAKVGKLFYFLSFYLLIVSLAEYAVKHSLFSFLVTGSGKASLGALVDKSREGFYRVKATFENTLTLMQYILFSYPLSVLYIDSTKKYKKQKRILSSIVHLLLMFLTFSRFGIAMLLLQIMYFFYLHIKKGFYRKSIVVVSVLLIFPVYIVLENKVFDEQDIELGAGATGSFFESSERVAQYVAGYQALKEHPLMGYGVGSAPSTIYEYAQNNSSHKYKLYHAVVDNRFLSIIIESGVLTSFAFLLLFIITIRRCKRLPEKKERMILIFMFCSLLMSLFILSIFTLYSLFFIVMAIINKKIKRVEDEEPYYFSLAY